MNNVKCFYHKSDLDGKCSAAIVKSIFEDAELIGVDYNDRAPTVMPDDYIVIVDFSFPVEDMKYLEEIAMLIWIDHHKSAIEKMADYEASIFGGINGLREIGKAGCELTWEYYHGDHTDDPQPIPTSVYLLGRYDVWDHKDERVLPFQYGMRQYEWLPDDKDWDLVFYNSKYCDEILHDGETIYDYQKAQDKMYAESMSYLTEFEGYSALVINKAFANSQIFDSVYNPVQHDILILWSSNNKNEYKHSIFTHKDIDVSEIAKKYGGGGHKQAAGFYTKERVV